MTKSRFDPDLEVHEDPDEAPLKEFWEAQRDREEAAAMGSTGSAGEHSASAEKEYQDPHENPRCPDKSAHIENAAERAGFSSLADIPYLSAAWRDVNEDAEAEYMACPGHY
jgi:hypothetical protein